MPQIDNTTAYPANGADALQFRRLSGGYTNVQTGTTYTLQAADLGVVVTLNNTSPITVTVPSGLGANFYCRLIQIGTGQVTVQAGGGVTLNSYASQFKIIGQHAGVDLWAYGVNVFNMGGATAA